MDEAARMMQAMDEQAAAQGDPRAPAPPLFLEQMEAEVERRRHARVIADWVARQVVHVPATRDAGQAVRVVLVQGRGLTPSQADRVWNWLQPQPVPDTAEELEEQVQALIDKVVPR